MTVRQTVVVAVLSAAVLSVAVAACSGSGSGTSAQHSTMVTVAAMPGPATPAPAPPGGAQTIPVVGGTVALQSASFSIQRVRMDEETQAPSGEHQGGGGENQGGEHSGQGDGGHEGQGDNEHEDEVEVVIEGPFAIDIASGGAVLTTVVVSPGTFRRAQLELHLEAAAPFDGDSIVIQGQFQPTGGSAIPFTLRSRLLRELEVPIANGGVTVANNAEVAFTVTFDLAAMFAHLDLHGAVVESGAIAIDDSHNATVLAAFEHNLDEALEGCEGHHEH
jgi:hypothetical protein